MSNFSSPCFASQIMRHLVDQGVRRVCLSPGSRSSLLSSAAASEPGLEKFIHFDERSMAFHAYGYAKSSQSPVAIVTTSGSAVGNILPAIMEAAHAHVPLIVLTADRPTELQETMANQTCDQVKIFGNYARWYAEIPAAEPGLSDQWLASTIAHAVFRSLTSPRGPVHLNCQFREPFLPEGSLRPLPSTHYEMPHAQVAPASLKKWADQLCCYKKGVIVAGAMPASQHNGAIFSLAEKLNWPLLADLMSGLRCESASTNSSSMVPYFIDLLKGISALEPDCILHLGDRIISKPLHSWLSKTQPSTYLMVADHPLRHDPLSKVSHRLITHPAVFCQELLPLLRPQTSWLSDWKILSQALEERLDSAIAPFSEPGLIRYLHHHLPSHYGVYFSNSMPIRDADRLFFPKLHQGPIYGQRGLSGIDGNIATAIGLAEGSGRPLVAVLGDLAALHDLNSLAQLRRTKVPVIFIVVNNQGGGIFSFLSVHEQTEIFEEYFAAAHSWNFQQAAEMFCIPYLALSSLEDLPLLHPTLCEEKTVLIEFASHREENVAVHAAIDQKTQEILTHLGAVFP